MRLLATVVLWLLTTVALAVAVPALWVQANIVDPQGYSQFAASAAKDPRLQEAMAAELTSEVSALVADNGGDVDTEVIRGVASAYTASSVFPGQFALANRLAHDWMFTDSVRPAEGSDGRWVVDLAPMLADSSFQRTLAELNVDVPKTLTVPVTVEAPQALRPGQLRLLARWGPWVSVGAAVVAGVFALLTVAVARSRGRAFAALGISALLVGAAGWAALEVLRDRINRALDHTTGDIRQVADVMVGHAEAGLHQWLNVTLAVGGVLVVFGVLVSMLAGLRRG